MSPFSALSPETINNELEYRRRLLAVAAPRRTRRFRRTPRANVRIAA